MSCARIIIRFFLAEDFARANAAKPACDRWSLVSIGARIGTLQLFTRHAVRVRMNVLSLKVSNNVQPTVKRTDLGER